MVWTPTNMTDDPERLLMDFYNSACQHLNASERDQLHQSLKLYQYSQHVDLLVKEIYEGILNTPSADDKKAILPHLHSLLPAKHRARFDELVERYENMDRFKRGRSFSPKTASTDCCSSTTSASDRGAQQDKKNWREFFGRSPKVIVDGGSSPTRNTKSERRKPLERSPRIIVAAGSPMPRREENRKSVFASSRSATPSPREADKTNTELNRSSPITSSSKPNDRKKEKNKRTKPPLSIRKSVEWQVEGEEAKQQDSKNYLQVPSTSGHSSSRDTSPASVGSAYIEPVDTSPRLDDFAIIGEGRILKTQNTVNFA